MDFIIGGYSDKPELIINNAINYFENRFSKAFDFEGLSENNYFMGIVKEKSKKPSNTLVVENKLFKSIYSNEIFKDIEENSDFKLNNFLSNISQDFIYCIYDKDKGIKVFVDKFTRQKIYYTIKPPLLFSSSLKFLFKIYDKKLINYDVLNRLICYGFNIGKGTVFSYINRLDIGEYLQISKNNLLIDKFWRINKKFFNICHHDINDISFWIDYVYNTFKKAVDWPEKKSYVSLLSGGIDSTVLTSLIVKEFNIPTEALTLKIPSFNERDVQKACIVAEYLNIPHTIVDSKVEELNTLENFYSEIFNILEEPVCVPAYLSRYRAFIEVKKLGKKTILLGEGGDEALGYIKPEVLKKLRLINYLYYIPSKFRYYVMKFMHKMYKPSISLINTINNRNIISVIDIIMNTNFLQSQNDLQSFFTTFQCFNSEEIFQMTGYKMELDSLLMPIIKECISYPFNDLNKIGYHRMIANVNGDFLVDNNIANFLDLKPYTLISNDIFWKNFISIPEPIKFMGDRDRWIVYEMARKKKLLPKVFFKDRSYYGFHQIYEEKKIFENAITYLKNLLYSQKEKSLIPLKPFERYLNISFKNLKKHSSMFLKFNVIFGTLGWFLSID